MMLAAADPVSHVAQHIAYEFGEGLFRFPLLSNHIIMQVLAALIVLWVIPRAVAKRAGRDAVGRLVPTGLGNAIEVLCLALRDHIFKPNLGAYTDRFLPYLWSLFMFILVSNLLGLIPLTDWAFFLKDTKVGNTTAQHLIGGTSTANIFITGALALITLVMMVYCGLKYHGMTYVKHFFMGPPALSWFIAILEVLGLFFKAAALALRLFANMLAGHILLAVLLGFVGAAWKLSTGAGVAIGAVVIFGSIAIFFLEIFVAFLHAFIFATLTAVFVGLSVNIHHDEHEHEHDHGHGHGQEAHAAHAAGAHG
ncbi:MAG: F0F1 ATP synthase subunit A [Planctomycetia bacterium]|nr:MAG: F0F1 ATP synthase subunit A [Planctomycetia bacterium]